MLDDYLSWVNSRKNSVTNKVKESLKILLENNPNVNKVWLSGSYVKGDWIDEDTETKYKEYKYKVTALLFMVGSISIVTYTSFDY